MWYFYFKSINDGKIPFLSATWGIDYFSLGFEKWDIHLYIIKGYNKPLFSFNILFTPHNYFHFTTKLLGRKYRVWVCLMFSQLENINFPQEVFVPTDHLVWLLETYVSIFIQMLSLQIYSWWKKGRRCSAGGLCGNRIWSIFGCLLKVPVLQNLPFKNWF